MKENMTILVHLSMKNEWTGGNENDLFEKRLYSIKYLKDHRKFPEFCILDITHTIAPLQYNSGYF